MVPLPHRDLRHPWLRYQVEGYDEGIVHSYEDFLGPAPSYVHIRDHVRRLCHKMIACSISGRGQGAEKYLFRHAEGRKSGARLSEGHFIGCLAAHFGLASDEGLRAQGLERQQAAAVGAPRAAEDALTADEGAQAVPAPVQAPQPPPLELLRALLPSTPESPPVDQQCDRIKPGSKFSTIVREYDTKPNTLSKSRVEFRRESDFKSVKSKEKGLT
ncbi:hypothetical protein Tco_1398936, partial [Tanacetum coccineum]